MHLKKRMTRRLVDNKGVKMLNLEYLKLDLKILRFKIFKLKKRMTRTEVG